MDDYLTIKIAEQKVKRNGCETYGVTDIDDSNKIDACVFRHTRGNWVVQIAGIWSRSELDELKDFMDTLKDIDE